MYRKYRDSLFSICGKKYCITPVHWCIIVSCACTHTPPSLPLSLSPSLPSFLPPPLLPSLPLPLPPLSLWLKPWKWEICCNRIEHLFSPLTNMYLSVFFTYLRLFIMCNEYTVSYPKFQMCCLSLFIAGWGSFLLSFSCYAFWIHLGSENHWHSVPLALLCGHYSNCQHRHRHPVNSAKWQDTQWCDTSSVPPPTSWPVWTQWWKCLTDCRKWYSLYPGHQ